MRAESIFSWSTRRVVARACCRSAGRWMYACGWAGSLALSMLAAAQVPAAQPPARSLPLVPARLAEFDEHEATWASLDVSPDGKTIAFELLGDIYTLPIAGGEAHCIACGLAFDSQPVYSPDGTEIAFVSDRDGNENLWVAKADGSLPRQISMRADNSEFVSPEWARDGKSIYIARFKPDMNAYELWRYAADGMHPEPLEQMTHASRTPGTPKEQRQNALGAALSPDGRELLYEAKTGYGFDDDVNFPLWHVVSRELASGAERTLVAAQGSAFRPQLSPDGRLLAYAVRYEGKTALRLRDLTTGVDRLLAYPVQRDDQESLSARDLLPRYAFTPDGKSIVANFGSKLQRIDVASGLQTEIPFVAHVKLPMGPYQRPELKQETGPVRARLIQTPALSPDGRTLAFSALARIYTARLSGPKSSEPPARLTPGDDAEFEPAWSPNGEWVAYVVWSAGAGGKLMRVRADGSGAPEPLTADGAYYSSPTFAPDGHSIFVLRANAYDQLHRAADFTPFAADLMEIELDGARRQRVVASGLMRSGAQFTAESGCLYLNESDGLYRVPLHGGEAQRVLQAVGPAYYFMEGSAQADGIRISPDGRWALAQIVQQLYLVRLGDPKGEMKVELDKASPDVARITSVGADFFGWADGGRTIHWAIGSTWFSEPVDKVQLGSFLPPPGRDTDRAAVTAVPIDVQVPRDTPQGALVLRGATVLSMQNQQDDGLVEDADVVVVDNRIAAVGRRGSVAVPAGATIVDERGRFIVPGFIDTHIHWGAIRRRILDTECWEFQSALAYGVTATLDPSSLSIDTFAYQDMLDAGRMVGSRVYTTGPALFSFNNIHSEADAVQDIGRNAWFYRTGNLKEYRTGNRAQREYVAQAARALGMLTTTEGALDMKLDMTQIQDGFAGDEHAFSAIPLGDDIVQLLVHSGVSYTPTLQISNGGMWGQDYFFTHQSPYADAKLRRFTPHFVLEKKMERMHVGQLSEYSFPAIAAGAARVQRAGGLVGVGSHGEVPGIGYQHELQALAMGGMTPAEVLWAATMGSAKTIGRDSELGGLAPGKFADLVVLDANPLTDIRNAMRIHAVMKNGRMYDGETLDEQWPRQQKRAAGWWQTEEQQMQAGN